MEVYLIKMAGVWNHIWNTKLGLLSLLLLMLDGAMCDEFIWKSGKVFFDFILYSALMDLDSIQKPCQISLLWDGHGMYSFVCCNHVNALFCI